tara:strand:- start:10435 stop:10662 length:228 start_codon:yes stop_codon:yes gene_type:complete
MADENKLETVNEDLASVPVKPDDPSKVRLVDVTVTDENAALNVLVGFCNLAQQRGAYNFEESAKILECIKVFQKK